MSNEKVWLTWEKQRRNPNLAEKIEAEYYELDYIDLVPAVRYPICIIKTVFILIRCRPKYVFAPYPSIVLSFILAALKPNFRYQYVLDAHNFALETYASNSIAGYVTKWIFKRADNIIVTNSKAAKKLKNLPTIVLPDALPKVEKVDGGIVEKILNDMNLTAQNYMTLLVSFSKDEPIEEVIKAALSLPDDERPVLCITGRKSRAAQTLLKYESDAIRFLDYREQAEFDCILANSLLLIDLTTRDDCLVCGGYEAMSFRVPILLSDTDVLRQTFGDAAIYCRNEAGDINRKFRFFLETINKSKGATEVEDFRQQYEARWRKIFSHAIDVITSAR